MVIDRRKANVNWDVMTESGQWYQGDYGGATLAVLMDVRRELQTLNRLLHCSRFTGIPRTLLTIARKLPTPKPRKRTG